MKKWNEWYQILGENKLFLILYMMKPSNTHDSALKNCIYFTWHFKVNASGDLEITEEAVVGLIDQRIAEGQKEVDYSSLSLEEIDALEDEEDERVLQVLV